MNGGLTVNVRAPDPEAFAPYGSFVERPDEARALCAVGGSPPDESLDPVELAALTVVANTVQTSDAFLMKR